MQLFFEFFPVLLFFLTFKFYGIYAATVVGIITTFLQVMITRLWMKKWDNKQLITLAIFVVFGGMTLYFHNPIFVKWKPTILFWLFAVTLLVTQYFTQKPLIQRLMENMLQDKGHLSKQIWMRLNLIWASFFTLLGVMNLYVAYFYSDDIWVNFKFYGITSALFIFSIFQACYLARFITEEPKNNG